MKCSAGSIFDRIFHPQNKVVTIHWVCQKGDEICHRGHLLLEPKVSPTVDGSEIRLTTWDALQNPVSNGINYQPQLVSRISAINSMIHP